MKLKIEIKNRWTGKIIFEYEKENNTLKETVQEFIRQEVEVAGKFSANLTRADLTRADLTDADLTRADLTDADLTRADLTDANLTRADLTDADLTDADLTDANLTDADLTDANLTDANLTRANLTRADLTDADLTRADLTDADLTDADLTDANLTDADLTDANLTDANLTRANLTRADLTDADLTAIKNDMFVVLLNAIPETAFLKKNLIQGKINGSTYEGECSCLSGTLYTGASNDGNRNIKSQILAVRDAGRPIERFFLNINEGDTPENSQYAKIALSWIEEFEMLLASNTQTA